MSNFSKIWNTEVKALAEACVTEPKLIRLMKQPKDYEKTDEEKAYLENVLKQYKDIWGMYHISNMIWQVEHALADGREHQAILAVTQIHNCLSSSSYLQNVFGSDESSEEWKGRMALKNGIEKLIK